MLQRELVKVLGTRGPVALPMLVLRSQETAPIAAAAKADADRKCWLNDGTSQPFVLVTAGNLIAVAVNPLGEGGVTGCPGKQPINTFLPIWSVLYGRTGGPPRTLSCRIRSRSTLESEGSNPRLEIIWPIEVFGSLDQKRPLSSGR